MALAAFRILKQTQVRPISRHLALSRDLGGLVLSIIPPYKRVYTHNHSCQPFFYSCELQLLLDSTSSAPPAKLGKVPPILLFLALLGQAPGGAGVKRGAGAGAKKIQGVLVKLPVQVLVLAKAIDQFQDGRHQFRLR